MRGKSALMIPTHTAVHFLKEQLARNVPGVTTNAFVFWYLPDTKTTDCILAWRPEQPGAARPIDDYAHVGDVFPLASANHKYNEGVVLVAVPKALSEAIRAA